MTVESRLDHVQVRPINSIFPAPENDEVYNQIALDNPDLIELARSIQEHGVQEPILISTDGFIISGHRRRAAALLAGLPEVPVRIYPISRQDDPAGFLKLLVEMELAESEGDQRARPRVSRQDRPEGGTPADHQRTPRKVE